MSRLFPLVFVPWLIVAPANAEEPKSFVLRCKVIRKSVEHVIENMQGKNVVQTDVTTLPELIALEASRAEYVSERKQLALVFSFRLQASVRPLEGKSVRLELSVEDTWSEGEAFKPVVHRHSQQVVRVVTLGKPITIALEEKKDGDEGIWVEIKVEEKSSD